MNHRYIIFFAALLSIASPLSAYACGGLFCSQPPPPPTPEELIPPEPVDQSAEQIIFEVHENASGEGATISTHVAIQYVGDPEGFAWVVPVPGVPIVEESSEALFQALDDATRMRVELPMPEGCGQGALTPLEGPASFERATVTASNLEKTRAHDHAWSAAVVTHGETPRSSSQPWSLVGLLLLIAWGSTRVGAKKTWASRAGLFALIASVALSCSDDSSNESSSDNASFGGDAWSSSSGGFSDAGGWGGMPGPPMEGPVMIHDTGVTPNYEFVVLSARDSDVLMQWLEFNDYNVSENMRPVMDVYNGDGKFLAIKLRDAKGASRIAPLKMTYESFEPMIPIQLTAVAAQSQMGISVMIVGDTPFVPRNYGSAPPLTSQILYDEDGRTNYFAWVSRDVEAQGGHHFISEYVGPNPLQGQSVDEHRLDGAFVSRYYTRISPEHMNLDPIFKRRLDASQRSAVLDLRGNLNVLQCDGDFQLEPIPGRRPAACAFHYCGEGGTCVEDGASGVGCECPEGKVAQTITSPDGVASVTCAPRVNPYAVTDEAGGAGTLVDPCLDYSCGAGECVLKGGFPACVCSAGAFADIGGGRVTCVEPSSRVAFGPGAGLESAAYR